jgi:outer membrane protease
MFRKQDPNIQKEHNVSETGFEFSERAQYFGNRIRIFRKSIMFRKQHSNIQKEHSVSETGFEYSERAQCFENRIRIFRKSTIFWKQDRIFRKSIMFRKQHSNIQKEHSVSETGSEYSEKAQCFVIWTRMFGRNIVFLKEGLIFKENRMLLKLELDVRKEHKISKTRTQHSEGTQRFKDWFRLFGKEGASKRSKHSERTQCFFIWVRKLRINIKLRKKKNCVPFEDTGTVSGKLFSL